MRARPYQFTVAAYIVHDEKVLLVKHRKLGKWLPPGGHIEQDEEGYFVETPEEAAVREVKEETGLDVEIVGRKLKTVSPIRRLLLPEDMHVHYIDESHDHLGIDYFCRVKGDPRGAKGEEEFRWFSEEELEATEIGEDVKEKARKALGRLKGTPL